MNFMNDAIMMFCDCCSFYCIHDLHLCTQLDKIVITFDGGITTMNFAEAAMLIQGSVCVYSKKVSMQCLYVIPVCSIH